MITGSVEPAFTARTGCLRPSIAEREDFGYCEDYLWVWGPIFADLNRDSRKRSYGEEAHDETTGGFGR